MKHTARGADGGWDGGGGGERACRWVKRDSKKRRREVSYSNTAREAKYTRSRDEGALKRNDGWGCWCCGQRSGGLREGDGVERCVGWGVLGMPPPLRNSTFFEVYYIFFFGLLFATCFFLIVRCTTSPENMKTVGKGGNVGECLAILLCWQLRRCSCSLLHKTDKGERSNSQKKREI